MPQLNPRDKRASRRHPVQVNRAIKDFVDRVTSWSSGVA